MTTFLALLWLVPAGWLALGLAITAFATWIRRGHARLGPFTTPNGRDFWIMPDDPLADIFGLTDHGTTFSQTVGLANPEATNGVDGPFMAHEAGVHVAKQFRLFGPLSVPLVAPLFVLLGWLKHSSPLEIPAYAEQARIAALPHTNPEYIAWTNLATRVNAALGAK